MYGLKMVAALAALLTGTSAWAQTGGWTVSEASGRVVIRDAAGERGAQRGSGVPAGGTVLTGSGARAVLVRGEDFVTVAANSRLRVPTAEQATGLFQMIQEWGNAVFRIKHLAKPHFAVQTPYLAAVVKGTTFSVTVNGEGASLQVIDGAVEVATTDGGAHEMVRPGTVATITAADRYRLSVQGQTVRVVDSPARGSTVPDAAAPAAETAAAPSERTSASAGDDEIAWSDVSSSVIAAPIEAKPVDLAAVTGGLVTGRSGADVTAANLGRGNGGAVEVARDRGKGAPVATPTPAPPPASQPPAATETPAAPDKAKPKDDGKPDDKVKPGEDGKPDTAKPGDEGKPDDKAKPDDDGKPDKKAKPGDDGKPDDKAKPGDDGKPDDKGKPKDDGKPDDKAKPGDDDKPGGKGGKGGKD